MHHHLGIKLNKGPNAPFTHPSTQNATASGAGAITQPLSSTRPAPPSNRGPATPRPPAQADSSQLPALQNAQQSAPQQAQPSSVQAAQPAAPNPAPPSTTQPAAAQPAVAQPHNIPAPVNEIAALRAQIAELECGDAHGNHLLARAPAPQQALVANPADIDHIQANLAGAKDESK
ncbi:hypothetical protein EV702DRAFT_1048787 [Suillus placidus]|uniref:Uncharacterized protein n=1 Tax=Suillus placidus TaxID=48579 RepID=A0A9P7CZP9_9AGAM|nr:hypothetical protein EV702DRAFT_1048787 [Suillus placidus]